MKTSRTDPLKSEDFQLREKLFHLKDIYLAEYSNREVKVYFVTITINTGPGY